MAWLYPWEAAPAGLGRGRLWSLPETVERADPTFVSRRLAPAWLSRQPRTHTSPPEASHPAGPPQFLHSAPSRPRPRPHTGFDPGSDPV